MQKNTHRKILDFDFVREELTQSDFVRAQGFSVPESRGGEAWRWLEGPSATLESVGIPRHGARLVLRGRSPIAGQRIEFFWNGKAIGTCQSTSAGETLAWEAKLPEWDLSWRLEIRFSLWNDPRCPFAPEDPRPLAFALSELRFLPSIATEGRICPYPFARMEMPGRPFIPCCQSWLRDEYFRLEAGPDPWNSPAAQELRASILDGTYRYCHLDRCGMSLVMKEDLRQGWDASGELPIRSANLAALLEHKTELPEGPAAATLMGDPRCNLACPSCRPEKVTKLDAIAEKNVGAMNELLSRYGRNLKVLKIAGDGEALFSPGLREVLLRAGDFPDLDRVDLLTNGLLLDTLDELSPGAAKVRRLSVSVDAGDSATYAAVRGGDWDRLLRNLEWASKERKRGRFEFLGLNFVVRSSNYGSLPAFFDLCDRFAVDEAYVSQLLPWERMPISLESESIHLESHPENARFRKLWNALQSKPRGFRVRTNLP